MNFSRLSAVMNNEEAAPSPFAARLADRALLCGLMIFALAIPHSIAAANIGLGLSVIAWLVRDVVRRRFQFRRTPLDWPLLCFAGLTLLSALLSEDRDISLPKLKGLIVFGVIWLTVSNLSARGVRLMVALLVISGLAGVAYSLFEKVTGRGMVVTAIGPDSPLVGSGLQTGDVVCFIGRDRVHSIADTARLIGRLPAGRKIEIEALHAGDPMQLDLTVTEALKANPNPLGVSVDGRTHRFRVSGFSRHFITYADQMQLLALLCFGFVIVLLKRGKALKSGLAAAVVSFALFSLALILTSSRAAIASFLLALLIVSALAGSRRLVLATALIALSLGGAAYYTLISTRAATTGQFIDDSTSRRIGYMRAGLQVIPKHPLLGVGMDAHKRHWQEWGFPGDYITHTHSTPIQIAMDRGLLALGCYVWLMAVMIVTVWRHFRWQSGGGEMMAAALPLGALGALIGFCAGSLVNYNFGDSEIVMLLLFVWALAYVVGEQNK
ncbi:MAG: O-antigen ligase family protein [Blastocatellia bacterium]